MSISVSAVYIVLSNISKLLKNFNFRIVALVVENVINVRVYPKIAVAVNHVIYDLVPDTLKHS